MNGMRNAPFISTNPHLWHASSLTEAHNQYLPLNELLLYFVLNRLKPKAFFYTKREKERKENEINNICFARINILKRSQVKAILLIFSPSICFPITAPQTKRSVCGEGWWFLLSALVSHFEARGNGCRIKKSEDVSKTSCLAAWWGIADVKHII